MARASGAEPLLKFLLRLDPQFRGALQALGARLRYCKLLAAVSANPAWGWSVNTTVLCRLSGIPLGNRSARDALFAPRAFKALIFRCAPIQSRTHSPWACGPNFNILIAYRRSEGGVPKNVPALFCMPLHCTAFDCDSEGTRTP